MISVMCRCGKKLKAPDSAAGRVAKCPACGALLDVPDPSYEIPVEVMEIADVPAPVAVPAVSLLDRKAPPAKRWYHDRVVLLGTLFPAIFLLAVGSVVAYKRSVDNARDVILERFGAADRLDYIGKKYDAYMAYSSVYLDSTQDWSTDPDVAAARAAASAKMTAIHPEAKKEAEAVDAANAVKARRNAELAAARARAEKRGTISGSIMIEGVNGRAVMIPDIAIRLLPSRAPFRQLGEYGIMMMSTEPQYQGLDINDVGDVKIVFSVLRDTGVGHTSLVMMEKFPQDKQWPTIMADLGLRKTISDDSGHFQFKDVPGGDYYVHAVIRVPQFHMEWLVPASVHDGETTILLDNEHAAYVLNSDGTFR